MCLLKLARLEWSRNIDLESQAHKRLWDEEGNHNCSVTSLSRGSYEALDFGRRLQVRRPRQLLVQLLPSQPPLGPGRYCLALAHPRFILPPLILTRPFDPAISPCA